MIRRSGVRAALVLAMAFSLHAAAQSESAAPALAEEVLEMWQVENGAMAVLQKSGLDTLRNARSVIVQRIPEDRQDALITEVAGEVQAYLDTVTPYVMERAKIVKQTVFQPFLLENFTENELRELVAILESPVKKKLDELLPTIQSEYEAAVVKDSEAVVKAELADLTERVNRLLRSAASGT